MPRIPCNRRFPEESSDIQAAARPDVRAFRSLRAARILPSARFQAAREHRSSQAAGSPWAAEYIPADCRAAQYSASDPQRLRLFPEDPAGGRNAGYY